MNKAVLYASIIFIFLGCVGSEAPCASNDPKEFIEKFISFQTIKTFENNVKTETDSIVVIENSKLSDTDARPEFSIYTVMLPDYKIGNITGKIKARFFNNRLMSVWFYPNDYDGFEKLLKERYDIHLKNREKTIINCVEINRWTDFEGNEYFGWSDVKLVKEQNDWISKHS